MQKRIFCVKTKNIFYSGFSANCEIIICTKLIEEEFYIPYSRQKQLK